MRKLISRTLLATILSVLCFGLVNRSHAVETDSMLRCAFRIEAERYERGDLITGHGTAFAADLSQYGFDGPRYLLSAGHNVRDPKGYIYPTIKIELRDDAN